MINQLFQHQDFRDEKDFLENFSLNCPEDFNFGFDCVDEIARTDGDKAALIWDSDEENGRTYSFQDIKELSDGAARFFQGIGIGKGDRVMLILKRRAHFWFALVGLMKIGAVAIPATHHLIGDDIVYRNKAASVHAIVCADDAKVIRAVEEAQDQSPSVKLLIRLGERLEDTAFRYDWHHFDEGIRANQTGAPLSRVTRSSDMMLLYFTSGTTGYPKMVLHNYSYPIAHIVTARYWHNLRPDSVHLTLSDTGWAKAVWGKIFGQWLCKAAVLAYDHEKLVMFRLLKMMAKHHVTSFCAPPTVYKVMLTADFSQHDLSALDYATSAGEPLNEAVYDAFLERTGIRIHEAYGQTETVPVILTSPYTEPRPGSLGKLNPMYRVLLLDKEGQPVSGAGEGEICMDLSPGDLGVFMGYYRNPDMTDYAWRDGLYHTGDLAKIDEDGYVYFIGRSDDIIKSAGYRIGPFEVESVIQQHESVLECAVTGVPDPLRGQAIRASIILRHDVSPSEALRKEIRTFIKKNAAAYKVPRIIEFVDELPKTISGKVRRAALRAETSEEDSK